MLLLERNNANPNSANSSGQTPLFIAACTGRERAVEMLLERYNVRLNNANSSGETPLLIAAENGRTGTVGRLLERENINPDLRDLWRNSTFPSSEV